MQNDQHAETVATLNSPQTQPAQFRVTPWRLVESCYKTTGSSCVCRTDAVIQGTRLRHLSLSAGIAGRGLQLCCAGYFGQGCTPRERTCR